MNSVGLPFDHGYQIGRSFVSSLLFPHHLEALAGLNVDKHFVIHGSQLSGHLNGIEIQQGISPGWQYHRWLFAMKDDFGLLNI